MISQGRLFVLLFCLSIATTAFGYPEVPEIDYESIDYQYQIFYDDFGNPECVGNLSFYISVPEESEFLIIARAITEPGDENPFYSGKILYVIDDEDLNSIKIEMEHVPWNSKIKILSYTRDGTESVSEPFDVWDYLETEDWELLTLSVSELVSEGLPIVITLKGRKLYVNYLMSGSPVYMDIFNLNGIVISSSIILSDTVISIENVDSPVIMVVAKCNNKLFNFKILVK